jgi:hypothetical protein
MIAQAWFRPEIEPTVEFTTEPSSTKT